MSSSRSSARQQTLDLRSWGGARRGAGRKHAGERARAPHVAREEVKPYQPVHVSLRMADQMFAKAD